MLSEALPVIVIEKRTAIPELMKVGISKGCLYTQQADRVKEQPIAETITSPRVNETNHEEAL